MPAGELVRLRRPLVAVALGVLGALACRETTAADTFVGVWTGSNAVFTLFQLNLQGITATSAHGAAQFVFAAPPATWADTDFVATLVTDSLFFSMSVPPATGHTSVDFGGRLRAGAGRIEGTANAVSIVLTRQ